MQPRMSTELVSESARHPASRSGAPIHRFFRAHQLRASETDHVWAECARLAAIVSSSDDAVISLDSDLRITTWNSGAEAVYGYTSDEAIGMSSDALIPADATLASRGLRARSAAGGEVRGYETQRLHRDGTLIDVVITAFAHIDAAGGAAGVTTITRNIPTRAPAECAVVDSERYPGLVDGTAASIWPADATNPADNVASRPEFTTSEREAAKQVHRLRVSQHTLAALTDSIAEGLVAVNSDGCVTHVNRVAEGLLGWTTDELQSHSVHDALHQEHEDSSSAHEAADCPLSLAIRTGATVRVEDDTFTRRDGRLLPVMYTATPITVDDEVLGMVLLFCDVSLRRAGERRHEQELDALNWVGRIRDALDENRLLLHAQPIVNLHSREVVMHELLLRMVDRGGNLNAPRQFLPAAEHFGLIEEIDQWVLAQAIQRAARGHKVHFNISGKSLGSRKLIRDLVLRLSNTGADPGLLVCEITETALADDEAVAEAYVHELSELGLGIALDDFGIGYGGFAYLKRLPVTTLKIDGQFVGDLVDNEQNQHVVKAIVNLAKGFGRETVAEGAEAEGTLELLEEYGVDYAQGFVTGRPAPIDTCDMQPCHV